MAKFRSGNLVLQSTQTITQGGITVLDTARGGRFTSLKLDSVLTTIIDEFSIDGTLGDNSDTALPTEQAVKTYVDTKIAGSIASSQDNRLTRYDGTDNLQGSGIEVSDLDAISNVSTLDFSGTPSVSLGSKDDNADWNIYFNATYDSTNGFQIIDNLYSALRESWDDVNGINWYVSDSTALTLTWVHALGVDAATGRTTVGQELQINGQDKSAGYLYSGVSNPSNTDRLNYDGYLYVTKLFNAVWNDIADFQKIKGAKIPGKCYYDTLTGAEICTERCQKSVIGILSDTFGFGVGGGDNPDNGPFAIAGWVLAYVVDPCEPGDVLTNDESGNLVKMSEVEKTLYPERIVATYKKPESKLVWGTEDDNISVNGRHWVKVK